MTETTGARDWTPLEGALEAAGADEQEFVEEAVAVLRHALRRARPQDPATQFSAGDAELLRTGGFSLEPRGRDEPDVVARTAARAAVMLVEARTTSEVAIALQVSAARVRQRAADGSLYAIRDGDEWRFPRWQFDPASGREIRGVAVVIRHLAATLHPIAVHRFFTESVPDLEIDDTPVSPVAWLSTGGDPALVVAMAASL
jgi:hypothetical protein